MVSQWINSKKHNASGLAPLHGQSLNKLSHSLLSSPNLQFWWKFYQKPSKYENPVKDNELRLKIIKRFQFDFLLILVSNNDYTTQFVAAIVWYIMHIKHLCSREDAPIISPLGRILLARSLICCGETNPIRSCWCLYRSIIEKKFWFSPIRLSFLPINLEVLLRYKEMIQF